MGYGRISVPGHLISLVSLTDQQQRQSHLDDKCNFKNNHISRSFNYSILFFILITSVYIGNLNCVSILCMTVVKKKCSNC